MSEIIKKLNEDHKNISRLLNLIEAEVQVFENGDIPDYEAVQTILNYLLTYPDLYHHPIEDVIVRILDDAGAASQVPGAAELEVEHQRLASTIRRFLAAINNVLSDAMLTRDWFAGIAREYIAFQRKHMQMEEVIIFPAAERLLNDDHWADVEKAIVACDDPLFG